MNFHSLYKKFDEALLEDFNFLSKFFPDSIKAEIAPISLKDVGFEYVVHIVLARLETLADNTVIETLAVAEGDYVPDFSGQPMKSLLFERFKEFVRVYSL